MKLLTTQEVFQKSDMPKRMNMTWQEAYTVVAKSLETNEYRMMRDGNSLLWFQIVKPGAANTWLFNADGDDTVEDHYKNYVNAFKKAGYKVIASVTDKRNELFALRKAGSPNEMQIVAMPNDPGLFLGVMKLEA